MANEVMIRRLDRRKNSSAYKIFKATCKTTKIIKNKQEEIAERHVEKMNTNAKEEDIFT
jgi:hypothetical protein